MSHINKICCFGGSFIPEGWVACDGNDGSPNLPPLVVTINNEEETINYLWSKEDNSRPELCFCGQIVLFSGNFAPEDWAFCDGAIVQSNSNQALSSILSYRFGGDGRTTFALPNLPNVLSEGNQKGAMRYIIYTARDPYPRRS